ncbi:hypothetical protein PVK06_047275 [Gossypium arboreum]|uniref:Nudix hydrolase domain-containing protein n=1 Tax=Gossypium arboreum TaxID=29729 RepID=A0ABR0MCV3_GOSAR|nr:hypothetical protein PVK06_047275 [Gossypium arboreum]
MEIQIFELIGWHQHRTLPTGYLEIRESAVEGAIRETWEEAGAEVEVISPFAQMDIPFIGQVRISILNLLLYLMCGRGFNLFKLEKPRLSTSSSGTLFNVAFHGHSS